MPNERPSRRGGTLVIILATLVPLCFAGWLVWKSAHRPPEQGSGAAATPAPSAPGSSGPQTSAPEESDPPGSADGTARPDRPEQPLKGKTVVLDPGHNPSNNRHPEEISRSVDIGTNKKRCDTTGTQTNGGYAEAAFTLDLSRRARTALEKQGATVKLTQNGDRPWGPCIDERAGIGNRAKADAVVSVHADGSAGGNRGFHIILPASVREGAADTSAIVKPSRHLGSDLSAAFGEATGFRTSNYTGDDDGLVTRDDLGGLNLSTVPKVFLECGNMRDAKDADRFTDPEWRARAAQGIADGITAFLAPDAER